MQNNNKHIKRCSKLLVIKREVYSNSISPQEIRKISNKQCNPTPKATRERRTKKTQTRERRTKKTQSQ